jgi:hypothetical protein
LPSIGSFGTAEKKVSELVNKGGTDAWANGRWVKVKESKGESRKGGKGRKPSAHLSLHWLSTRLKVRLEVLFFYFSFSLVTGPSPASEDGEHFLAPYPGR